MSAPALLAMVARVPDGLQHVKFALVVGCAVIATKIDGELMGERMTIRGIEEQWEIDVVSRRTIEFTTLAFRQVTSNVRPVRHVLEYPAVLR